MLDKSSQVVPALVPYAHDVAAPPLCLPATSAPEQPHPVDTEPAIIELPFVDAIEETPLKTERPGDTSRTSIWSPLSTLVFASAHLLQLALHRCAGLIESTGRLFPVVPASLRDKRTRPRPVAANIPNYVLEHAPLVHLHSQEEFWPCDIASHLRHVTPSLNYTALPTKIEHWNLTNLDRLNTWAGGHFIYLQSKDDVETRPDWLSGRQNIPSALHEGRASSQRRSNTRSQAPLGAARSASGQLGHSQPGPDQKHQAGRSAAPAVLVVVEKEFGIVDAFWFFFYSYNLGNEVFSTRFGNHVGDWEHVLVRFQNERPNALFFSEHFFGEAYSFDAVEKIGSRPVTYSARGTHAMYGAVGSHDYILPFGLLKDVTDKGPLWDPSLNAYTYAFDTETGTLRPSTLTPDAPTEWFDFAGRWGDKSYPLNDSRQYEIAGQYHYVDGPLGPRFKDLGRGTVCQGKQACVIKSLLETDTVRIWPDVDDDGDQDEGCQSC
ncbi:MAG: Vacuolar protein sorting-associated protein 62 [Lichina confinis]|nr:MAG: Vacuolar protein sorting-associated protein 62 [Lichina confinis]